MASSNDYQQYRQAGIQVLVSLSSGDSNAAPRSAWCWKALARLPTFTEEVMALIDGLDVDGINLDWERGANNSIPCFLMIWGNVSKVMRAQGKRLAISIDDSKGLPFNNSATEWAYETDWLPMVPFADELINMGTYPGTTCVAVLSLFLSLISARFGQADGPKGSRTQPQSTSNRIIAIRHYLGMRLHIAGVVWRGRSRT